VGTRYPPEWKTFRDPFTGRRVQQLTDSAAEDYHLYFYNPSVTPDDRYLIFVSERTGISNLFRLDLACGEIIQLTDARPVRADYWPFTYSPIVGVGTCLPAIGAHEVFYFEGNRLAAVDWQSLAERTLLEVPPDRRPSMLQTNATGTTTVFATWDEALFAQGARRTYAGEAYPEDAFYQATTSTVTRLDTKTGECREVLRGDKFWINHVLIHPTEHDLILFCHEYSALPDRMWLLNAGTGEYASLPGQGPDEWYEHEFWSPDGTRICFHGGIKSDRNVGFCGWYELSTGRYEKFYLSTPGRAYGHYNAPPTFGAAQPDGETMVTDGEARPGFLSRVHLREGAQQFEPLCCHDSYKFGDDQRCHPHPSFTRDGRRVIFTSNQTGTSNVYLTDWSEIDR
jgi:oligogalacturonide lyase